MSDDEFELLDELYFLQSYGFLKTELNWDDERLMFNLQQLAGRGWIKCYKGPDEEVFEDPQIFTNGKELYYLATKQGLLKHNMI